MRLSEWKNPKSKGKGNEIWKSDDNIRSTSSLLTLESKIHLYRAVISPILFFASECWELQRSEHHIAEKFHKKVKRICGSTNYKGAFKQATILPPLYFKVLKDLLMISNLVTKKYDLDILEELQFVGSAHRRTLLLPDITCEVQRLNKFWYSTGFKMSAIEKPMNFFNKKYLKYRLLQYMWNSFERNWIDQNLCTRILFCICENCRVNPRN